MAAYSECERWVAEELSLREQGKVQEAAAAHRKARRCMERMIELELG